MKDHKPENYENIHKYLFKCAIFHLITMSFLNFSLLECIFSEQFTQELFFFPHFWFVLLFHFCKLLEKRQKFILLEEIALTATLACPKLKCMRNVIMMLSLLFPTEQRWGKASKHSESHIESCLWHNLKHKEPCRNLGFIVSFSKLYVYSRMCVCALFLFLNNLSRDVYIMSNSGLRSEKFKQLQKLFDSSEPIVLALMFSLF